MTATQSGWTRIRASLEQALAASPPASFALLVLDLDKFRAINHTWGYARGTSLIQAVADRLSAGLKAADQSAHLGGDEFVVVAVGCDDHEAARDVVEQIHRSLAAPFQIDGHQVFLSVSIGIALSRGGHATPEACLRAADAAMYTAKSFGHGHHVVFDRQLERRVLDRHTLEHDLRAAIARRELRLHYQPVVNFDNEAVEGFEALVRWQHPEHGLLLPDLFIPVAEETGLVVPLGWLVLEEACRQLAEWQRQLPTPPFVSVNMSSRQFRQPDVVSSVEQILAKTSCRPDRLRFELTETTLLEYDQDVVERLAQLSALGIRLYIDDFGTGYSSLSYLHQLPTHAIKIDRSFVRQITGTPEIVGTIVNLARSLDMDVEAEGIETDAQLSRLRQLGCECGQGFYFSKPVTPLAAAALIS